MKHLLEKVHPEWQEILKQSLAYLPSDYQQQLQGSSDWLPGFDSLFAAFRSPLESTRYILLGESPYPRAQSANGYAFWDAAVGSLWSPTGFSKAVNRATSLRNLMKMLLHARGDLIDNFSQDAVARLDQSRLIKTSDQLFNKLIKKGFLLLNASLVYSPGEVTYHAKQWRPFMDSLLQLLRQQTDKLNIQLILLGKIAAQLPQAALFPSLVAEHPYNISFITNPDVINFFKPMDLLYDDTQHNS